MEVLVVRAVLALAARRVPLRVPLLEAAQKLESVGENVLRALGLNGRQWVTRHSWHGCKGCVDQVDPTVCSPTQVPVAAPPTHPPNCDPASRKAGSRGLGCL